MNRKSLTVAVIAPLAAATALSAAPAASAGSVAHLAAHPTTLPAQVGNCTGPGTTINTVITGVSGIAGFELIETRIQGGGPFHRWRITITQDSGTPQAPTYTTVKVTSGGGGLRVKDLAQGGPGSHSFITRATDLDNSETCAVANHVNG